MLPAAGVVCSEEDTTFLKWREACWKLFTYASLTLCGLLSCWGEPWLSDTQLLWRGWPSEHTHSASLRLWYAIEFGLYLYAVLDLLVWEAVRGDYYAMILHHASTLSLLGASFFYGFLRAGAVLLMLNDFVDLWFEGAKLAKYAKAENVSTGFFIAFVASWAWLRQLYCPFWFCASLLRDGWALVEQYGPTPRHIGIWAGFNCLVWSIVLLHTYWFFFLLQKIKGAFLISCPSLLASVSPSIIPLHPLFSPPSSLSAREHPGEHQGCGQAAGRGCGGRIRLAAQLVCSRRAHCKHAAGGGLKLTEAKKGTRVDAICWYLTPYGSVWVSHHKHGAMGCRARREV